MKTCCDCKQTLPLTAFWRDATQRDGLQCRCIPCGKLRNLKYNRNNKDKIAAKNKAAYDRAKNPERYARQREAYLRRRDAEARSVRGRLYSVFHKSQQRSKLKNLVHGIDFEFVLSLWGKQQGKCAVTGIEMTLERNPPGKRFFLPWSPSLDKIDASGLYTEGNVRLVCVVVNLALNRFGDDVFDRMCRAYIKHKEKQNES